MNYRAWLNSEEKVVPSNDHVLDILNTDSGFGPVVHIKEI